MLSKKKPYIGKKSLHFNKNFHYKYILTERFFKTPTSKTPTFDKIPTSNFSTLEIKCSLQKKPYIGIKSLHLNKNFHYKYILTERFFKTPTSKTPTFDKIPTSNFSTLEEKSLHLNNNFHYKYILTERFFKTPTSKTPTFDKILTSNFSTLEIKCSLQKNPLHWEKIPTFQQQFSL